MNRFWKAIACTGILSASLFFQCGKSESGLQVVCKEDEQQACFCPGEQFGTQVCRSDKKGWETCECRDGNETDEDAEQDESEEESATLESDDDGTINSNDEESQEEGADDSAVEVDSDENGNDSQAGGDWSVDEDDEPDASIEPSQTTDDTQASDSVADTEEEKVDVIGPDSFDLFDCPAEDYILCDDDVCIAKDVLEPLWKPLAATVCVRMITLMT